MHQKHYYTPKIFVSWGAAIAQWICVRLPYCHPRFESQAHHLHFLYSNFVLYCHCVEKRTKIKEEAGFGT